jgi:hypothetical protein
MFHSGHLDSTRPVRELSGRVITASMALFTRRYNSSIGGINHYDLHRGQYYLPREGGRPRHPIAETAVQT